MRITRIQQVDVGAVDQFCGYSTTVIMNGHLLSEKEMKLISNEIHNYTTAVILPSIDTHFRLRTFTTDGDELHFSYESCLAAACAIKTEGLFGADLEECVDLSFETNEGIYQVSINSKNPKSIVYSISPHVNKVDLQIVEKGDFDAMFQKPLEFIEETQTFLLDKRSQSLYFRVKSLSDLDKIHTFSFRKLNLKENQEVKTFCAYFIDPSHSSSNVYIKAICPTLTHTRIPFAGPALPGLVFLLIKNGFLEPNSNEVIIHKGDTSDRPGSIHVEFSDIGEQTLTLVLRAHAYSVFSTELKLTY